MLQGRDLALFVVLLKLIKTLNMKKLTFSILTLFLLHFNSIAQISLGSGLALDYRFTGNANDNSGNSFHGTVVGATLTSDRFGIPNQAYNFNGTSNYIRSGNILNSVFAGAGNKFSISVWIKPATYMSNNMILAKIADGACGEDQRQFYFRIWNGKIMFGYSSTLYTGNYRYPTGSTNITDTSKWYHIVVMYDGTINTGGGMDRVKIYVDNVSETITVGATSTGTLGNIQAGAAQMGIGDYLNTSGTQCNATAFNGKIDDIRIYDRLLNTAEIDAIFNGPSAVGIDEEQNNLSCSIYPNPGSGKIYFSMATASQSVMISLTDVTGKNVYKKQWLSNNGELAGNIDFSNYPKGIYFISFDSAKGRVVKKIVITD